MSYLLDTNLIGATAVVHGPTVVTRNVADVATMGVAMIAPWSGPQD